MKFIMLINVKLPTIVGILTLMSMINTIFKLMQENAILISILVFTSIEISCFVELSMKKYYNLGARTRTCHEIMTI